MNSYVSIIIPTYNREHLIRRSIQSILDQTYPFFELIIVDDGSKDNTRALVEQIGDPRIRYISCEVNQGQSAARNRGISEARYDLIAFQDSDDEWDPDKLEKQIVVLAKSPREVGAVYCEMKVHLKNGEVYPGVGHTLPHEERSGSIFPKILERNLVGAPTLIVKREVFQQVGVFDESLKMYEDYDLVLKIAKEFQILLVPDTYVQVHQSEGSISFQEDKHFVVMCYLIGKYQKELIRYDLFDQKVSTLFSQAKGFHILNEVIQMLEEAITKGGA